MFSTDIIRSAVFGLGIPTLAFALEMSRIELAQRILAAQYSVPLHRLVRAELDEPGWLDLARQSGEGVDAPLWVDDNAEQTFADMRATARRMHRAHGLGFVVVDHLGLIKAAPNRRGSENRQLEVAANSRSLKVLAKDLGIPVLVCAQINRNPEHRTDKRPQLADLRESGAIEADADVVILLHREDYYEKESPRAGEVDIIVAKNRNGQTGTFTAAAQLHFSRFVDMAVGM